MTTIRFVLAALAIGLPASGFAQANLAGANYIGVVVGTGKVGLNCPSGTRCSPVDTNRTLRAGHRFNESWAFEVAYAHTDADWGVLGYNYSAEFVGFSVGAAYTLPLSASVGALVRVGGASNELKLQPAVAFGQSNPGTLTTRSVKPYVGLGLSWQFARHWSTSFNVDLTRADLRETPNGSKQSVTVRTLGAGIALNF
ncbi:outer membrane beta-barrel protein [Roseateles sp. DC23W]|uniref:Outer membrane beta-barrel protein n=1 Tax=Pelomonas dachongensis TaxID=3299029 RepID=A0ABW7EPN1_9BURK